MIENARNYESRLNTTNPTLNPSGSYLKSKNFNNPRRRLERKKSRLGRMLEVDIHGLITQPMGVERKSPLLHPIPVSWSGVLVANCNCRFQKWWFALYAHRFGDQSVNVDFKHPARATLLRFNLLLRLLKFLDFKWLPLGFNAGSVLLSLLSQLLSFSSM